MSSDDAGLAQLLDATLDALRSTLAAPRDPLVMHEVGYLTSVGQGVARARGLPGVCAEELVYFGRAQGMAMGLDPEELGIVILSEDPDARAGAEVRRSGRVLEVPVGEGMLGRVMDPLGNPLDGRGPLAAGERRPVERPAPAIMDRAPVSVPLQTGVKVVDALVPMGRGQRQLILGDRQTGKTALALDTIINQRDKDVVSVFCAIGCRGSAVAKVVDDLRRQGALHRCVVVVAEGDDPPGRQFIAPYAATSIAEYFMDRGRDVLIVYDDLTRHAIAYREISLLLRRPPGREAFPGDIFFIHSRLLERATHLHSRLGGGSLTALPIVETEAQNLSAYIPTNLISITDGQIYLSPVLFNKGILPAVDVGLSVSRVGGKAQLPAYRAVTGELRLSYAQFEELEAFSRFGTRLDPDTKRIIERGRRAREVLKQSQYEHLTAAEQILVLLAAVDGLLDHLTLEEIGPAEQRLRHQAQAYLSDLNAQIAGGDALSAGDRQRLHDFIADILAVPNEEGSAPSPSLQPLAKG